MPLYCPSLDLEVQIIHYHVFCTSAMCRALRVLLFTFIFVFVPVVAHASLQEPGKRLVRHTIPSTARDSRSSQNHRTRGSQPYTAEPRSSRGSQRHRGARARHHSGNPENARIDEDFRRSRLAKRARGLTREALHERNPYEDGECPTDRTEWQSVEDHVSRQGRRCMQFPRQKNSVYPRKSHRSGLVSDEEDDDFGKSQPSNHHQGSHRMKGYHRSSETLNGHHNSDNLPHQPPQGLEYVFSRPDIVNVMTKHGGALVRDFNNNPEIGELHTFLYCLESVGVWKIGLCPVLSWRWGFTDVHESLAARLANALQLNSSEDIMTSSTWCPLMAMAEAVTAKHWTGSRRVHGTVGAL